MESYYDLQVIASSIEPNVSPILSTEVRTIEQGDYNGLYGDSINSRGSQSKLILLSFLYITVNNP